jgi:hypothetical protein
MTPDDTIRQLRQADPAPLDLVEGAARGDRAQAVLDGILRDTPSRQRTHRAPRRAPLGVAAGIAAVLLVVAVTIGRRPEKVELPAVRFVLSRAAEAAARSVLPQLGPGQYLYATRDVLGSFTAVTREGTWTALVPIRQEIWIASDGSGRIREVPGDPTFPGPRDRELWRAAGEPSVHGPPSDRNVPPGALVPDIHGSTEADQLASALLSGGTVQDLPKDQRLFVAASDLLSTPLASPALRSSLYRLVAGLEGVELLGEITDPIGRPGIGVAIPSRATGAPTRRVLIFDATTSEVLAEEVVLLERVSWIDADPPIVTESRVFGPNAIVSSDHARPGA